MLRIIAGKHRGRRIEVPKKQGKNELRPTTGMAREAIFNILTHGRFAGGEKPLLEGCTVLDLFCGSGALGLEALSRGAARAIFIDINPAHIELVRENATRMGEEKNCAFLRNDSSNPPPAREGCHLVFIDPPYESRLTTPALQNIARGGWLEPGAVVVVETAKNEDIIAPEGYRELDVRRYGLTKLTLLEWAGQP